MEGYDAANTAHHATATVPEAEPTEQWRLTLEKPLEFHTGPVVHDGRVYVGARGDPRHYDGKLYLYALDAATGSREWTHSLARGLFSSAGAAAVDGTVYVRVPLRDATEVHALDAADGTTRWTRQVGGDVVGSFVVVEDALVVTAADSLLALDVETGEQRWRTAVEPHSAQPAVGNGAVHVGCTDDTVRAFDLATGDRRWRYEFDEAITTTPSIHDGVVYAGSSSRLVALADGEETWTFEPTKDLSTPAVAVDDERVYVGGWRLYGLDAATGDRQWARKFEVNAYLTTPPVVADGTVVAAPTGSLAAFDAASGIPHWSVEGPWFTRGRPAVVDGRVYAAEESGTLFAFADRSGD